MSYSDWYAKLRADPVRYRARLEANERNRKRRGSRKGSRKTVAITTALGPRAKDMTGRVCGRLYVLGPHHKDKHQAWYWLCECECGREHVAPGENLRSTMTVECRSCSSYRTRYGRPPEDKTELGYMRADQALRRKRTQRAKARRQYWERKADPEAHERHLARRRELRAQKRTHR